MFNRRSLSLLFLVVLVALSTGPISGQVRSSETLIPLEGLDPVMLSQGKEVQGDMKYRATRGRFEYLFASEENKAAFEKDPSRYEIQLNGHCARMGAPVSGNPDLYTVHNNRIYVFGSEACQTLFKAAPEKYLEVSPKRTSPPAPELIKRGHDLIDKAVAALGGAAKLDQLVSFQKKDQRANDVKTQLLLAFPDVMRQESSDGNHFSLSVITPSESFLQFDNNVRPMPEANRTAINQQLLRELIVLFRARTRPDFKAWLNTNASGEKQTQSVDIELSGFTTTLGIDPESGRVVRQSYRGRGPGSVLGQIEINYSDYRAVAGLLLPFKTTATFDGEPYPALSATIEEITINGQIDPASFKKPQSPR